MGYTDFPGGAVGKNPPASAGDMCLILGPARLHVVQGSESPCTTATEPGLWSQQATTPEAHVLGACAPQQEKPP